MQVIEYWRRALTERYTDFAGRSRRMEYWSWVLVNFVIGLVISALFAVAELFVFLYIVWVLAIIVPGIAVAIRRLHDTDKSGWWLFIAVVPFVGPLVLLVFFLMDSTRGTNQYGPSEKYPTG